MKSFEDTHVPYMLNQAAMPFFKLYAYPAYTVTDFGLVQDRSEKTVAKQTEYRAVYETIKNIANRVKRGMHVPKTWIKAINLQVSTVEAAVELGMVDKGWAAEFARMIRFLTVYKAAV
jgi:hypothetical protein